jgi:predicted lysophospholipase L1 biosynthesis ABC-type transport system permease subunit
VLDQVRRWAWGLSARLIASYILVTLVASLRPALRATRVPPLAAVREGATLPKSRFAFLRLPGSILLTILGFAALSWALFGPGLSTTSLLVWMGVGALMIFLGVALLVCCVPIARIAGRTATPALAE